MSITLLDVLQLGNYSLKLISLYLYKCEDKYLISPLAKPGSGTGAIRVRE